MRTVTQDNARRIRRFMSDDKRNAQEAQNIINRMLRDLRAAWDGALAGDAIARARYLELRRTLPLSPEGMEAYRQFRDESTPRDYAPQEPEVPPVNRVEALTQLQAAYARAMGFDALTQTPARAQATAEYESLRRDIIARPGGQSVVDEFARALDSQEGE